MSKEAKAGQDILIPKIETEFSEEIIEMARRARDLEGYYTPEESLSNARDGLAPLFRREEKNKGAERLENFRVIQVHC